MNQDFRTLYRVWAPCAAQKDRKHGKEWECSRKSMLAQEKEPSQGTKLGAEGRELPFQGGSAKQGWENADLEDFEVTPIGRYRHRTFPGRHRPQLPSEAAEDMSERQ